MVVRLKKGDDGRFFRTGPSVCLNLLISCPLVSDNAEPKCVNPEPPSFSVRSLSDLTSWLKPIVNFICFIFSLSSDYFAAAFLTLFSFCCTMNSQSDAAVMKNL